MGDKKLRRAVVDTARAMNGLGINRGTSGNVSARSESGFLITPTGVAYDALTPDMIVETDLDGGFAGKIKPSSEWRMHADIYRARPEAEAVVHTHSTYATALSTLRRDLPAFHYMIARAGGATIRCSRYATFGTQELSDAMVEALEGRKACLLANHGVICFEANLAKALALAVEVEELARQYAVATAFGTPAILDEAEMGRVIERFQEYGQQSGG